MNTLFLGSAAIKKLAILGKAVVLATPRVVRVSVITGGALFVRRKIGQAVRQIHEERKIQKNIKQARKRIQKDIKDPQMRKELKKEFRRIEMKFSLKSLKQTQQKIDDLRRQEMRELAQDIRREQGLRR